MSDWNYYGELERRTACDHEQTEPKRYKKQNGVVCVCLQCRRCGEKIREVAKRDYDVDTLPWLNEAYRDKVRARKEEIRKELVAKEQEKWKRAQEDKQAEWQRMYETYLRSSHWAQLRRRVIQRDNFECQDCFRRVTDATAHVHHISYVGLNRVGRSFAFECVTLCAEHHIEFHPHMQAERVNGF